MADDSTVRPLLSRAQIASVAAGNALEFYDFVTYSFFAIQIGRSLFPGDASQSLILSLATFGVGFVSRPLGGLVIGRMADRRGRKPAMILSFALMGIGIVGLALTPSYRMIGAAAPVLAIGFRLIQGFALGGEVGPNAAFLMEAAPPHRRGFYLSIHLATSDLAVVFAGIVGLSLSSLLDAAQLDAWGWRIAFLIGASIVPFGLALRRTLEETLPPEARAPAPPGSLRPLLFIAAAGMLILGAGTISNYTLSYLTTYAQDTLHMAVRSAFAATIVFGLVGALGDLATGWLSDRYRAQARADRAVDCADRARGPDLLPARCDAQTRARCSAPRRCSPSCTSSDRPPRSCCSSRPCRPGSARARSASSMRWRSRSSAAARSWSRSC